MKKPAYCYEYELLAQLLDCKSLWPLLLPYLKKLETTARALYDTSFDLAPGRGWQSGHQHLRGPESWSTASVYHFAHSLDRLIAEAVRKLTFEYLDQQYAKPGKPSFVLADFAPKLLDSPVPATTRKPSLHALLFDLVVLPIAQSAREIENGFHPVVEPPTSAILFGPPGTSKTKLSEAIARFLNWPLLVVDPSYFVKNGFDGIHRQADQLFDLLLGTEQVVVLLDEVEELVRDRNNAQEILSRFLTTGMLPKLARVTESRRLMLIVATNHIDKFDLAIRRRFDSIIQVMPPTLEAKLAKWEEVCEALDTHGLRQAPEMREMLERLTFKEFEQERTSFARAEGPNELELLIKQASQGCTLMQEIPEKRKTWAELCRDQICYMRLPQESPAARPSEQIRDAQSGNGSARPGCPGDAPIAGDRLEQSGVGASSGSRGCSS